MNSLTEKYNYYIHELSDRRTYDWPFVATPWPLVACILMYLLLIYIILPLYMRNRKPYSLRRVIMAYNSFQVIACSIIVYGLVSVSLDKQLHFGCHPLDYDKEEIILSRLNWWTFILKAVELLETCFFVLRKKYNQVSLLHVYHHVSTLTIGWMVIKYYSGGMSSFVIMLNSMVHVLMYTYYLLASLGPKWQNALALIKPKLTIIQMVQFVILVLHSAYGLSPSCNVPKFPFFIFIPDLFLLFFMFYEFYQKNYHRSKKIN